MIKVPDGLSATISSIRDDALILGIRPKDIIVLRKDEEFDGFKVKGEVTFIELLGDDSIAEVKLGQNSLKISNVPSKIDNLIIGKETVLGIKYDKIYLFTNSGERINSSIIPSSV
jgi:ABC-type sugar transport system ATPase subunit